MSRQRLKYCEFILVTVTPTCIEACDIMMDQIRAVDNSRLVRRIGALPDDQIELVKAHIRIIPDLV